MGMKENDDEILRRIRSLEQRPLRQNWEVYYEFIDKKDNIVETGRLRIFSSALADEFISIMRRKGEKRKLHLIFEKKYLNLKSKRKTRDRIIKYDYRR